MLSKLFFLCFAFKPTLGTSSVHQCSPQDYSNVTSLSETVKRNGASRQKETGLLAACCWSYFPLFSSG